MVESEGDANLRIYLEYLARECAERLLPAGCQDAAPDRTPVLLFGGLLLVGVVGLGVWIFKRYHDRHIRPRGELEPNGINSPSDPLGA